MPNKTHTKPKAAWGILVYALCCFSFTLPAQIANYVNNGGFEECSNCGSQMIVYYARYWQPLNSSKYSYGMFSELPPSGQVPNCGFAWQWPKSGHNYVISTLYFKPNTPQSGRGYPRNVLKQNLQAGKTYCVKFYCNVANNSTYGTSSIGAYFGDSSLDTITISNKPLTYLTRQIQNQVGNFITDTLNWVPVTGTFTANGNEKYMLLGNFKNDSVTDSLMINPTYLPTISADILYDDVSCIDVDLPADAGSDYYLVPGDSAFIGRQPDVGINGACTWYQLPNTTTSMATIAGMYVKPTATTTYVVRQEVCGLVKWDTVIVFKSAVGIEDSKLFDQQLSVYPVPTTDELLLQWGSDILQKEFTSAEIFNDLGQLCLETGLVYDHKQAKLYLAALPAGVYTLRLKSVTLPGISKRFTILR